MEQIRSFIAIELPGELRQGLARIQSGLKTPGHPSVKWVDPDSIHLTLKFLGSIAADRTGDITQAMNEAVQGIPPFHLDVQELGVFPNIKRVQVVWVGLGGEVSRLAQLKRRLEAALAKLGFATETRPFSAHLTLARLRHQAPPSEREDFGRQVASSKAAISKRFKVTAISLMKSRLTREGAIYHRLSKVALKPAENNG